MKNLQKTFLFMFVLLLTLSGCIGQKGEKKADCASNQSFDQRSRQCVGAQKPPQPLLDDITIFEDQGAQTITLSYTDPNGSEASSCKVNFTGTNVWMRAPEWDNAAARASQAHSYGFIAANSISPGLYPVQRGNAFAQEAIANASRLNAAAARTNAQMVQSVRLVADSVRQIGNIALGIPDSIVQARGADAIAEATKMDQLAILLENMCSCVGGICKTVALPDKNWFGDVGFTYTISDSFGTGPVEQVTLSVQSINDTPHPQPQDVNDTESTNSTASPILFTVNAARDVEDDIFSSFFTYQVTNGTNMGSYVQLPKGRLYDCMGIGGSAPTDRSCTYTPTSGNDSGVGSQAAAYNFQGIDWFAKSTGTWGNDIKVTFVEHPITRMGGLNGADGEKTVDITVVGKEITIMIESDSEAVGVDNYDAHTVQNVIDAINANTFASALVTVVAAAPVATPVTTGTITLASGTDGLDFIKYKVNDGLSDSSWEGVVSINVFAADDFPQPITTTLALNEDASSTLTLAFYDAEGAASTACNAQTFNSKIQPRGNCTCSGASCSLPVQLLPNENGTATFEYNVTVASGTNNPGPYSNPDVNVTINAVNDPPYTVSSQIAANESANATPANITFTISPAYEVEGEGMSYKITQLPTKGTISGCAAHVVGATISPTTTCNYMPDNGNDNGVGVAGRTGNINDIFYTSRFSGAQANKIKVQMTQTFGVAAGIPIIYYNQEVVTGELHVHILIDLAGTTTSGQVAAAINSHAYLGQLIYADIAPLGGVDTNTATAQSTFAQTALDNTVAGVDPMDYLEYEVIDTSGAGNNTSLFKGRHHIVMNPTNDFPAICNYSKFTEAPECGLLGCQGASKPVGLITPSKEGIVYYHSGSAICYISKNLDTSGALVNTDWEIVRNGNLPAGDENVYIADQKVNEMEKVVIDGIRVDEGGGDSQEDPQQLVIVAGSITSSDPILIPVSQVVFKYNGATLTPGTPFGGVGTSEDTGEFEIEISPAGNKTGTSEITFKLDDTAGVPGSERTVSFKVTVYPVAIKHNGWINISAVGPGKDAVGTIFDMNKVCTYSRTKCNGSECKGSSDPVNVVTPDKKYAIYYNTLSKQCYYADGTTSADWKVLDTHCNVSPSEYSPNCAQSASPNDEGSCLGTDDPRAAGLGIIPTGDNQFFYDVNNKVCYRSRADLSGAPAGYEADDWEPYDAVGQVTLEWEDFTVFGQGVLSGYNVYRRISGEEFDYDTPINKTSIGPSTKKFVDNSDNSWYAPVPGTVYYYDVRPILNGIPTGVSSDYKNFNIVRLIVPPSNHSFVHRWIVNKSICKMMNSTTIDPDNNFRCIYQGPGSVADGDYDYYDISDDMIVERFEAGCNFNRAPDCGTPTGDCAGNFSPNGVTTTTAANAIFYDRSTGSCYRNTGGTAWSVLNGASTSFNNNNHTIGRNPPLVNLTQIEADSYCDKAGAPATNLNIRGYAANVNRKLPNRKEQIAYSIWDDSYNTDTQISILETGLSINSSSKCNSSNASGLENGYSDTAMTNSNTEYSMPGTAASNIRSIITGSSQTKLCKSRFDIQDVVGNVSEFSTDRIDCDDAGVPSLSNCVSVAGSDGAIASVVSSAAVNGASAYTQFQIAKNIGPCRDTDSDGECDAFIDKMILDEERYSAGRFHTPMGLPAHVNFPSNNSDDSMVKYSYDPTATPGDEQLFNFFFEIGPSSGIMADKLHDDVFAPNTHYLFATTGGAGEGVGAMTTGGSYRSGSGAGVFNAEFVPLENNALGFVTIGDVSFKRIGALTNYEIEIVDKDRVGGSGVNSCSILSNLITVEVTPGVTDATTVAALVNGTCSAAVRAEVSGVAANVQITTTAPVSITNVSPKNASPSIGFRCMYRVNDGSYTP